MRFKTIHRPKGFDITNVMPADIDIRDIARALTNMCRYGGHTKRFYSVAEHSIRLAQMVNSKYCFEALMHDAVEAYVCDLPAPLKQHMPAYRDLEARVDKVVRHHFGLPKEMSPVVDRVDIFIREFEMWELMGAREPKDLSLFRFVDFRGNSEAIYCQFLNLFNGLRDEYAAKYRHDHA